MICTDSKKPDWMRLRGAENLALALASGCNVSEAARRAGITPRTVYHRRKDPEFAAHVRALRAEILERTSGRLADGAARSAEVLVELLESDSEQTRLHAARAILEHVVRVRDAVEVEQRLQALEERAAAAESQEITHTPRRLSPSWPSPNDVRERGN